MSCGWHIAATWFWAGSDMNIAAGISEALDAS
jgi:hypothetical protein